MERSYFITVALDFSSISPFRYFVISPFRHFAISCFKHAPVARCLFFSAHHLLPSYFKLNGKNEVTSHYVSVPPLHARKFSVPLLFFVIVHQWTVQTVQNHKFLTKNHPPRVLKELHSLRFCSHFRAG